MPSILNDRVELRHLRYFRALAEEGSFTRAAAAIGLKQPTLSHQVRQLEDELGAVLFHRARNACRLTAAGELLLPYVQRVLAEMEALRQALDDQSGLKRGSLMVAVLPVLAEKVVAQALALFNCAHPGIQVRLLETSVDEMGRVLASGGADLCIGTLDTVGSSVACRPLYEEELVAVVSTVAAKGLRGTISVAELARHPLVAPPPGFGTRTMILRAWAKARRTPRIALEASSTEVVLRTVASGNGVGVLPASALWGRQPEGWLPLRIRQPAMRRRIGVFHPRVGRRSPAAGALIPLLVKAVADCAAETPGPEGAAVLCRNDAVAIEPREARALVPKPGA